MLSHCSILSDMFSLGMVMCTIFNQGHALIQANNSSSSYLKQLEMVSFGIMQQPKKKKKDEKKLFFAKQLKFGTANFFLLNSYNKVHVICQKKNEILPSIIFTRYFYDFFRSAACSLLCLHINNLNAKLDDSVHNMLPRVPIPLQEAISRLTCKEAASRPTAQLLQLIKYFR